MQNYREEWKNFFGTAWERIFSSTLPTTINLRNFESFLSQFLDSTYLESQNQLSLILQRYN
jgi:hypothetical protein